MSWTFDSSKSPQIPVPCSVSIPDLVRPFRSAGFLRERFLTAEIKYPLLFFVNTAWPAPLLGWRYTCVQQGKSFCSWPPCSKTIEPGPAAACSSSFFFFFPGRNPILYFIFFERRESEWKPFISEDFISAAYATQAAMLSAVPYVYTLLCASTQEREILCEYSEKDPVACRWISFFRLEIQCSLPPRDLRLLLRNCCPFCCCAYRDGSASNQILSDGWLCLAPAQ